MYKMSEKTYLYIFILCAFLTQGIVGTFLKDDLRDSTNLIRQKRVINRLPGQDVPYRSTIVSHIVNIKVSNRVYCIGTVLSMKTVITAARCVFMSLSVYKVLAGAVDSRGGSIHNITDKRTHGDHQVQGQNFSSGIALIYVSPSFHSRRGNISPIGLHTGLLLPNMRGTVCGWGSYYLGGPCQTNHAGYLRAIQVPIMNHQDCVNSFRGFFNIEDKHFCTHDVHQQCGFTDAGVGFFIDNSLAGIYIGSINTGNDSHLKPDVFIMLQHSDYKQWILRNIQY